MTQRDYEDNKYMLLAGVDEAFKSIRLLSAELKNAEDTLKNSVTLLKIKDCITDVNRFYGELEELERQEITEEPQYTFDAFEGIDGFDSFGNNF